MPHIKSQFKDAAKKHGRKILVVDDDRGLLKILKANLEGRGFEVLMATTGEEGLRMAQQRNPDLILLDVILPKIKGREVCKKLKSDEKTRDIPIVFLTSKSSPDDVRAELQAGAVSHITKPLDSQRMLHEVYRVLGI